MTRPYAVAVSLALVASTLAGVSAVGATSARATSVTHGVVTIRMASRRLIQKRGRIDPFSVPPIIARKM